MKNKKLNYLILIIFVLFRGTQFSSGQNTMTLNFGKSKIHFDSIFVKTDSLIFINLHNNEQTSIKAIKQVLPAAYGEFLGLQSGGKRELTVSENGKFITFDPNRIFTKTGIELTLKKYKSFSTENIKLVDAFAKEILAKLSKAKLIIALHNNTDGGYSIQSISKTNEKNKDATDIFINFKMDEDDFYIVTEKSEFDFLKSKSYNVVLQDSQNVADDGSLSVYCGRHQMNYINIECQNGHLAQQIKMIQQIFTFK